MKERPILFSAPMVRAILEGAKTQTRRLVKRGQVFRFCRSGEGPYDLSREERAAINAEPFDWETDNPAHPNRDELLTCCPYGAPGDRLWVREAFRVEAALNELPPREVPNDAHVWYEATDEWRYSSAGKLRPSMFLPRWASRITLEVTGVRVERLQDISEEDARAEGVEPYTPPHGHISPEQRVPGPGFDRARLGDQPHRLPFANLWDAVNGKRAPWASNPWVWVVEFKRAEAAEKESAAQYSPGRVPQP